MKYPTMAEVESASRIQLARWYRFLVSPGVGLGVLGRHPEYFEDESSREMAILNRIISRFNEMGNFTPEISKIIGWDKPYLL